MKRLPKLVVVADRGRIVAYVPDGNNKALRIFKELDLVEGQDTSAAEPLTLKEERRTRALLKVAHELGQLLAELAPSHEGSAATPEIDGAILVLMDSQWDDSPDTHFPGDAVPDASSEIAKRFEKHSGGPN